MKGVTPILVAKPDDETRSGKIRLAAPALSSTSSTPRAATRSSPGPSSGPTAAAASASPAAHSHKNWGNDDFRKLVLNAILWTAKLDVPSEGVPSSVTPEDLTKNLDPKGRR